MTAPRPICVLCGQAYGRRRTTTETVKWPRGEPMPEYEGNGIVTSQSRAWLTTNSTFVAYRYVWDGESWSDGHQPFCTLRCALAYARAAFKKHGRIA